MKKSFIILTSILFHSILYGQGILSNYSNKFDFPSFEKQCNKKVYNFDSLSYYYEKELDFLQEKQKAWVKDSLGEDVMRSWDLNFQGLRQGVKYQNAALANSNGRTVREQDSLYLCEECAVLMFPKNKKYILDEDLPKDGYKFEIDFNNNQSPSNSELNEIFLTKDQWFDYSLSFWVIAGWADEHFNSEWVYVPLGAQICDIEYKMSGREEHEVKLTSYSPIIDESSDTKYGDLLVKAWARGNNNWFDQKSGKCVVDVQRVRLIPLYYTKDDRARLGCKDFKVVKFKSNRTYTKYLKNEMQTRTISSIESFPNQYPLD